MDEPGKHTLRQKHAEQTTGSRESDALDQPFAD
jgi:hypothetical protein